MDAHANRYVRTFLEKYPDANTADGCTEPGYDDKPVILANWNNIPEKVFDKLEAYGFSCEWEDEWLVCDRCYKAFRSSPDSYGWEMYGIIGDGEAICGDCIDMPEYLESITNEPHRALTCSLMWEYKPLEQYGYKLIQADYESGFHPGQNDDPQKILASLLEKNPAGRYVFVIDGQGQFDISFSVYEKITESED